MALDALRTALPPDLRHALRRTLTEGLDRARWWEYEHTLEAGDELGSFVLEAHVRRGRRPLLRDLFGLLENGPGQPEPLAGRRVVVFDGPRFGALRVPGHIRMLVPLACSEADLLLSHEQSSRGNLRRLLERSEVREVKDAVEARRINRELIVPYALARHGMRASLLAEPEVLRYAAAGGLHSLLVDGQEVAAQLGFRYRHRGRRHWMLLRAGYPSEVLASGQWLGKMNRLNCLIALRLARARGYDVCDVGLSVAAPDGGLLRSKRLLGGRLSLYNCSACFWVRLPSEAEEFLWRRPLFAARGRRLDLHVGVPPSIAGAALLARLRRLSFTGLDTVWLHSREELAPELLAQARELYGHRGPPVDGRGSAERVLRRPVPARPGQGRGRGPHPPMVSQRPPT